jgi:hypothetical protein
MFRFLEKFNPQPVLKAQAFTSDTTVVNSAYTKLDNAHWLTYVVPLGDFGTTASSDTLTLTVECSTAAASNATEVQVPFRYRISGKPDSNSMGAITTAVATDGFTVSGALGARNGAILFIEVDPAEALAAHAQADAKFVRLVITASTNGSGLFSAHAVIAPRYPGNTHISAT